MLQDILAKSSGRKLIDHSQKVSEFAVALYRITIGKTNEEDEEKIRISALLHDIAKCCESIQDFFKNKDNPKKAYSFSHNEIGWAFIVEFLNLNAEISYCVYWHHGINKKVSSYTVSEVISKLSQEDIDMMKKFAVHFLGENILRKTEKNSLEKAPEYFKFPETIFETNKSILYKSCVISADRIVSDLEKNNIINEIKDPVFYLNSLNQKENNLKIENLNFENFTNEERLSIQLEVAKKQEIKENTATVNGPAGLGKTLIGILQHIHGNKKTLWVCPNNYISRSVYANIIKALELLGIKIKAELFLTGELEKNNHTSNKGFDSDIIITNIDNFLIPTTDNSFSDRLYFINTTHVVFDEFHALINDSAYFSIFIEFMRIRHRLTNSTTLLLSATPSVISFLWDSLDKKTIILPNKDSHYKAAHNKPYHIKTKTITKVDQIESEHFKNELIILNSIFESQEAKFLLKEKNLIHSSFEDERKEYFFNFLLENYGKNNPGSVDKENVIGTHLIQASLDCSFKNLYESVLSPEGTFQRIGRNNRFGLEESSTINIYNFSSNKSEEKVISILYNNELNKLWYEFMKRNNNKTLTLDELYKEYNSFNILNEKKIKAYIQSMYIKSREYSIKVYPRKKRKKAKDGVLISGANPLRTTMSEIFITMPYHDKEKKLCQPMSTKLYDEDFTRTFKEKGGTVGTVSFLSKKMKESTDIFKETGENFDYSQLLSKNKRTSKRNKKNNEDKISIVNLDEIRKAAKFKNTPYIINKVFHPDYGPITREQLIKYTKIS